MNSHLLSTRLKKPEVASLLVVFLLLEPLWEAESYSKDLNCIVANLVSLNTKAPPVSRLSDNKSVVWALCEIPRMHCVNNLRIHTPEFLSLGWASKLDSKDSDGLNIKSAVPQKQRVHQYARDWKWLPSQPHLLNSPNIFPLLHDQVVPDFGGKVYSSKAGLWW